MSTSNPALAESLEKLQQWMEEEQCEEIVELCSNLLNSTKERGDGGGDYSAVTRIPQDIQLTLYDIWIKALLRLNDLEGAQQILSKHGDMMQNSGVLQAYIQYRRKNYRQTMTLLQQEYENNGDGMGIDGQLLAGQAHYRLHETKASQEAYLRVLNSSLSSSSSSASTSASSLSADQRMQVLTNFFAVATSNATPPSMESNILVPLQEDAMELLKQQEEQGGEDGGGMDTYPYDLAYNLATYRILTGQDTVTTTSLLSKAKEAAIIQEGQDSKEVASIVSCQHLLQRQQQQQPPSDNSASSLVSQINASLSMSASSNNKQKAFESYPQELDDSELYTPYQRRLYYYNKAILAMRANQLDQAMEATQQLQRTLSLAPSSNNGSAAATATTTTSTMNGGSRRKKKGKKSSAPGDVLLQPASTSQNEAWWLTQAKVLEANILIHRQHGPEEALQLLQDQKKLLLSSSSSSSSDETIDHAVATIDLWMAQLSGQLVTPQQRLDTLSQLPTALQSKKSVLAAKASLLKELDQNTSELLNQLSLTEQADFALNQKDYDTAVKLYKQDPDAKLQYIHALSFIDPFQAQDEWDALGMEPMIEFNEDNFDADELERRPLPRIKASSKNAADSAASLLNNTTTSNKHNKKNKKSREAVMRRRTRQRQAYLEAHPELKNKTPDPERWLPKHERSSGGRRNRHNRNTRGHQGGGVSEKDAAKLDVAARLADANTLNSSSAPSTANMAVTASYNSRKGGRRR